MALSTSSVTAIPNRDAIVTGGRDIIARCPNGKIRGRITDNLYVVMRVDMEDLQNVDADVLAYSYDPDECGCQFMETIAARDCYGKWWDFTKDGSPCFDPYRSDGTEKPPPPGKFMMWDETGGSGDSVPDTTVASITIYNNCGGGMSSSSSSSSSSSTTVIPTGILAIRRYKLVTAQPTINDYIQCETEGDRVFLKS